MEKKEIRKKILLLRNSQSRFQAIIKSHKIKEKLFRLPEFIKAKTILFYVSTKSEVKTDNMIREALNYGKRIIIPISNKKERTLKFSEIKDFDRELEPGTFNILEPKKQFVRPVLAEELDLVIIPGVAFDKKCNRIGYGIGFYDRFLSSLKKRIPIIGLAYELQIVDDIPIEEKDVTVDKIITEKRIIERD